MSHRDDAIAIWKAGVDAVRSDFLVRSNVRCHRDYLEICGSRFSLQDVRNIEVVGAGKAGAGMVRGLEVALSGLRDSIRLDGWVNVPRDCVEATSAITLFAARPAGSNEPTAEGVKGTREILKRVRQLDETDLCIVLISGGGSALLPAPAPGVSLDDKLAVTRVLAAGGADICELNVVRSQLSEVKGGGLVRNCGAGRVVSLIISDVIGDPLEIIASGPTTPSTATTNDALAILQKYDPTRTLVPASVYTHLERDVPASGDATCAVENFLIGSNAVAIAAADAAAKQRGYEVINLGSENAGEAADHGRTLFQKLADLRDGNSTGHPKRVCLLAGGETTVKLAATSADRKGGRNQECILAAVAANPDAAAWQKITLLSGGTDGEDGPTDAAGAIADAELVGRMHADGLQPNDFLTINNSYPFFDQLDGLVRTGPTHTNVMDLAVGVLDG